jgi:hypothetical protein
MKKLKIGLLTLTGLILSLSLFSQAPTASGNVMNFSSVAAYEPYADDESTWASLRNIAVQSSTLTTLAEQGGSSEGQVTEDTLYPDFVKEVLNTDYIFQIGSYLIKIDLFNDRGLVIDAGNTNAYASLVNNDLSAPGMMVLDGDEDFGLELLEALANNTVTPADYQSFLNAQNACGGAQRKTQKGIEPWAETSEQCDIGGSYTIGKKYGMDNKVVYQKVIFFFSLQSKIRSLMWCTFGGNPYTVPVYPFVDVKLSGTVKFRKRCGTEVNDNVNYVEGYFGEGDGILNWRPYSGGRSLSHYDFNVDFGIRPPQDRNPNPPPYFPSVHYRIVSGY